jgi:hypothetical protein
MMRRPATQFGCGHKTPPSNQKFQEWKLVCGRGPRLDFCAQISKSTVLPGHSFGPSGYDPRLLGRGEGEKMIIPCKMNFKETIHRKFIPMTYSIGTINPGRCIKATPKITTAVHGGQ